MATRPMSSTPKFVHVSDFAAPSGRLRARWTEAGLFDCELLADEANCNSSPSHPLGNQLRQELDAYRLNGQLQWNLELLDWQGVTDFQRAVLEACYQIPSGTTATYGQLATIVGRPQAARAVGGVMARNRWPIIIPCHRVVGAGGKMTGYSAADGIPTKKQLLNHERSRCGAQPLLFS